jgi:hypothetical protein
VRARPRAPLALSASTVRTVWRHQQAASHAQLPPAQARRHAATAM